MTIQTIKFSQMTSGGNIANNEMVPGLQSGANVLFNFPWTFLPPGTTADRPTPIPSIYYLLRLNTDIQAYEYYNPITMTWTEVSGSGTGTIDPGLTNDLAYYAGDGETLSPISANANSVLVTDGSSVPSLETTLPSGLTIPGATITSSTASLTSGQVAATPTNPTDIANKAYVDAAISPGVTSITGTAHQIIASASTGDITLSTPQDIDTTSSPTFASINLGTNIALIDSNGNPILTLNPIASAVNIPEIQNNATGFGVIYTAGGPTSDANIAIEILAKGNAAISFATTATSNEFSFFTGAAYQCENVFNFASSATTNTFTWPATSGTVALTSQLPSGAALTKTDDTNVTLTLGGTPSTALLQATSITVGWTGDLAITRGGTGVGSVTTSPTASAWAGWDANSNLSANNLISELTTTVSSVSTIILTVASTQIQNITGSTAQTIQAPDVTTLPRTGFSYTLLNNSSALITVVSHGSNTIGTIQPGNEGQLICTLLTGTTAASWFLFTPGITPAALSEVNDTNVTMALTGFPTISMLQPVTMTLGWTGQLGLTRGGTAASLTASNGGIVYSSASSLGILSGTSTAQQLLVSGANTTPQWTTSTYPLTNAINTLLYASSANTMAALTTANSSVLVTSAGGVPSLSTTLPSGIAATNMVLTTPNIGAATATSIQFSTLTGNMIDSNGNNVLQLKGIASAVNYAQIQNNVTSGFPIYSAVGSDTNIGLEFLAKGTGTFTYLTLATSNQVSFLNGATYQNTSIFNFPNTAATQTYTWPTANGTVVLTGSSPTLSSITATNINFGGSNLGTYTEGTWTPIDASGASLTFSTAVGTYTQIGNMVIALGEVVYPSTADGSNSLIGGLPVTVGSTAQKTGGAICYTSASTLARALAVASSTTFRMYTTAGVRVVNSALSLTTINFQIIYFI